MLSGDLACAERSGDFSWIKYFNFGTTAISLRKEILQKPKNTYPIVFQSLTLSALLLWFGGTWGNSPTNFKTESEKTHLFILPKCVGAKV